MTELYDVRLRCPECDQVFTTCFHSSICTWLGVSLIQRIYDEGYIVQCKYCKASIPFHYTVLINSPHGMFYLDLGEDLETIRKTLEDYQLIDSEGKVLSSVAQRELLRQRKRREAVESFFEF